MRAREKQRESEDERESERSRRREEMEIGGDRSVVAAINSRSMDGSVHFIELIIIF